VGEIPPPKRKKPPPVSRQGSLMNTAMSWSLLKLHARRDEQDTISRVSCVAPAVSHIHRSGVVFTGVEKSVPLPPQPSGSLAFPGCRSAPFFASLAGARCST